MDRWIVIPTNKAGVVEDFKKSGTTPRPASAVPERGRNTRTSTRAVGRARSVDSEDNVSTNRSRRRPKIILSSSTTHRAPSKPSSSGSDKSNKPPSSRSSSSQSMPSTPRSLRASAAAEHRSRSSRAPAQGLSAVLSDPSLLPWFYPLGGSLLVGRKPKSVKELAVLQKHKVTAVVSVVQPHEHEVTPEQVKALGFSQLELCVREGDPLSLKQLLDGVRFLRLITEIRLGRVYVHCRLGRVRCVMLTCAFVMAVHGLDPAEAEDCVLSCVPCGKLRRKHRETLGRLCLWLYGASTRCPVLTRATLLPAAFARVLRAHAGDDSFTMY